MSLFDFLFPEQAQASHLRGLLRHQQNEASRKNHERTSVSNELEEASHRIEALERQVDAFESKLAESEIVTRALVELIFQSSDYTAEDLKNLIEDIDAQDGVIDGRITPEKKKPRLKFVAKHNWKDRKI